MEQKSENKFTKWVKTSTTLRMIMVGFLILILMIPLSFIESLIGERAFRQESVISEINDKWGKEVMLYGPILRIPYKTYSESIFNKGKSDEYTETYEEINYAYFFPEKLHTNAIVHPEKKHRGIYQTAVYQTQIKIDGAFSIPNFSNIDIEDKDVLWDKAKIILKTTNLKGVNDEINIEINKNKYPFIPIYQSNNNQYILGSELHKLESNFINENDLPIKKTISFKIDLNVDGSEHVQMIPIGKETTLNVTSNWEDQSFIGNYLPYEKEETTTGLSAKWKVLQTNRPYPQEFFNELPDLSEYAFGVNFMIPVDQYQQSERSVKYGYLVIFLTFLIFFLIQSLSKINIHPFQYLMIGIALTMFYTLLISISEHSNFLKAYLIASASVIGLITLYSKSILKNWKFPLFILVSLSILYGFIYTIIQLESYALLVGSIGLFLILASVMYASRKIDWS